MDDKLLISFMKSLKDKKIDKKEEVDKAFRRVAYTINGIHRSILLTYGNISSFNTNKKADELFRRKMLLNYYILDAELIINNEIKGYCYLDFIFPGACILIGEYDSRICKLKTYLNQLLILKEFLKNNTHLSIGLWYWELSRLK